jgi:hypothetical protein
LADQTAEVTRSEEPSFERFATRRGYKNAVSGSWPDSSGEGLLLATEAPDS